LQRHTANCSVFSFACHSASLRCSFPIQTLYRMEAVASTGCSPSCGTMSRVPTYALREENTMSGWAWMAIGATVLAVVIMQIAMRIK